ncbi:MAG: lipopolysaccharide transport system permease protein [Pseudonocardiales bacterium]|jgi:lipopolysaccharide transport system permease protein|nr:lipopolysaccharide transport system permease protein [Pseudonocardiales bacterium]
MRSAVASEARDTSSEPLPEPAAEEPRNGLSPHRQSPRALVADAWAGRALVRPFGSRIIRKMYAKTILGATWLFIRPIVDTGGRALLFGSILGVAGPPNGVPYFLFLLVGMQSWRLFDQTLFWATRSFDRHARFTRRFAFPLLLVPIAGSAFAWVEFAIYTGIAVFVFALFVVTDGVLYLSVGPQLLMGVAGLLLATLLALGVGFWLCVLNARWRDVRLTLRYVLEIWLYATPVIYPLSQIPSGFRTVAQINPMTPIVEMTKQGFLDAGDVTVPGVIWAVSATAIALGSGLWFFGRYAARFISPYVVVDDDEEEEDMI